MELAKGLSTAVDEPGILLFKCCLLGIIRYLQEEIDFLTKHWTFIFDPHHDSNTCSFYSNPTESSAIGWAYFRI